MKSLKILSSKSFTSNCCFSLSDHFLDNKRPRQRPSLISLPPIQIIILWLNSESSRHRLTLFWYEIDNKRATFTISKLFVYSETNSKHSPRLSPAGSSNAKTPKMIKYMHHHSENWGKARC